MPCYDMRFLAMLSFAKLCFAMLNAKQIMHNAKLSLAMLSYAKQYYAMPSYAKPC
jgi:hypothetical protein